MYVVKDGVLSAVLGRLAGMHTDAWLQETFRKRGGESETICLSCGARERLQTRHRGYSLPLFTALAIRHGRRGAETLPSRPQKNKWSHYADKPARDNTWLKGQITQAKIQGQYFSLRDKPERDAH